MTEKYYSIEKRLKMLQSDGAKEAMFRVEDVEWLVNTLIRLVNASARVGQDVIDFDGKPTPETLQQIEEALNHYFDD